MAQISLILLVTLGSVLLSPLSDETRARLGAADVVILGEVHDNPLHHQRQAALVKELTPKALVVEMLTPDQAGRLRGILVGDPGGASQMLGWDGAGWPDFEMYRPIFLNASGARIYGAAMPRDQARSALETGIAKSFGDDADTYGLSRPLPEAQQAAREALQFAAHCDALPKDLLPGMVDLQRMRDAMLARNVLAALTETGGPVVVITGNGHARRDWGLPTYLGKLQADAMVFVLGQGEGGADPDGGFDLVLDAPPVDRPDPCDAFR